MEGLYLAMMGSQTISDEEYKNIFSKVPRLSVDILILSPEGVLLTLRHGFGWEGMWHLPGGSVYFGETLTGAVKRIAKEKLGIKVKVGKLCGYIEYPDEVKEKGFGQTVSLPFLCQPSSTKLRLDQRATRYGFFKSLPKNMVECHREFLKGFDISQI